MCAIAGVLRQIPTDEVISRMLATMRRRGPDDSGVFTTEDVCLLHSRLSVIDPDGGAQPMTVCVAGKTYTIVYNGELYNTEEIRSELKKAGHIFSGHSDTEVVVHAYAHWRESALPKLNGIFGFAIWEHKDKRLFLARDRMGVKPLFYTLQNGKFLFASEIKTLLAHPDVKPCVDAEGIAQILYLGPGRIPGSGVFHGIHELKPGWFAVYQNEEFSATQYWKLQDREHSDNFAQTVEKVRYLVLDSIKRQMVSDVPLGTFLSGGLDSSLISAVCAEEKRKRGEVLDTFSVDYKNNDIYFTPGKFQPNSDAHFIDVMQTHISSNHHRTVLTSEDLVGALEEATQARDLPGMADVDISLLVFCKQIRKNVKVALSGECADEIFGGYPWYRDPEIRAMEGFPWAQNTKQRALLTSGDIHIDACEFVNDLYRDTIAGADILPGTSDQERRMKEMVVLNQQWFMQTLLDRKDRMSMFSGLEVRVPFCDYRIAEYLYGVPWEFKDYQGREKGLLRMAVQDLLPEEIVWRKKSPYPKTYDPMYLDSVRKRLIEVINDPGSPLLQIVRKDALMEIIADDSPWPWYGQLMKLPQTIAYMLQVNYWLKHYNVDIL